MEEVLKISLLSLGIWVVVHFLTQVFFNHKKPMWRLCVPGIIHSLTIWFLTGLCFYSSEWRIFNTPNYPTHTLTAIYSAVFFAVDIIPNYFLGTMEMFIPAAMHHVASVISLSFVPIYGEFSGEIIFVLLLMEISNPFMCLNMMLKADEKFDSIIFQVNERVFEFLFIFCRVFIGGWFTFRVWVENVDGNKKIPIVLAVSLLLIHLFTLMFAPMIVNDFIKRDIKGMRRKKKK